MQMEFNLNQKLADSCVVLGDFKLSRLLLVNNSHFPWLILVPRRAEATEVYKLCKDDQISLIMESNLVARVMDQLFSPDKLNIASIGNIVPQLHVHHVARFKTDPAWPGTVWGHQSQRQYEVEKLPKLVEHLQEAFKSYLKKPKAAT